MEIHAELRSKLSSSSSSNSSLESSSPVGLLLLLLSPQTETEKQRERQRGKEREAKTEKERERGGDREGKKEKERAIGILCVEVASPCRGCCSSSSSCQLNAPIDAGLVKKNDVQLPVSVHSKWSCSEEEQDVRLKKS